MIKKWGLQRKYSPIRVICLGVAVGVIILVLTQLLAAPKHVPRQRIVRHDAKKLNLPFIDRQGLPVPPVPPPPAVMVYKIATHDPVIFVTIDDGVHRPLDAAEYMQQQKLPTVSFLTTSMVERDPAYFATLQQNGSAIANHTVGHPVMPRLPYTGQVEQICQASKRLKQWYGERPTWFRPPYGEYNLNTKRAAAVCGIERIILWSVVLERGKLQYQSASEQLEPGDIVLLHFKPDLKKDLEMLQATAQARGLRIGKLADYLPH